MWDAEGHTPIDYHLRGCFGGCILGRVEPAIPKLVFAQHENVALAWKYGTHFNVIELHKCIACCPVTKRTERTRDGLYLIVKMQ